jgi:hypothetical protein
VGSIDGIINSFGTICRIDWFGCFDLGGAKWQLQVGGNVHYECVCSVAGSLFGKHYDNRAIPAGVEQRVLLLYVGEWVSMDVWLDRQGQCDMSDEVGYNAGNPAAVRAASKAARQADRTKEEILRGIMSLPPGRAWMLALLGSCGLFQTTFTGDAQKTAFNEGRRSVGLELMSGLMDACPDQLVTAMRENNARQSTTNPAGRNGNDYRPEGNGNGGYTTAESDAFDGGDDACGND